MSVSIAKLGKQFALRKRETHSTLASLKKMCLKFCYKIIIATLCIGTQHNNTLTSHFVNKCRLFYLGNSLQHLGKYVKLSFLLWSLFGRLGILFHQDMYVLVHTRLVLYKWRISVDDLCGPVVHARIWMRWIMGQYYINLCNIPIPK